MDVLLQQIVNGLCLGAIYALIAAGYSMVYAAAGVVNLAHGHVVAIGILVSLTTAVILTAFGIGFVPLALIVVLVAGLVMSALLGWMIQHVAYRPLRNAPRLASLIVVVGISMILQNTVTLAQEAGAKQVQPIAISPIIVLALAIASIAGASFFLRKSSFGRVLRAIQQDKTMVALLGIDVDRVTSVAFVAGAGLAAVAALLLAVFDTALDFSSVFGVGIKALAGALLGGFGLPAGAMIGGFLIGFADGMWSGYVGGYSDIPVFAVLVLVLVFRPYGLLGHEVVEKI